MVEKPRADYWADLDAAIEAERNLHGQKPLKDKERRPEVKKTKVSRSDPDSDYRVRDGKPKGFFSLDHRTVHGKLAIITDAHVTPANVHDSIVYLSRLDRQQTHFGFRPGTVQASTLLPLSRHSGEMSRVSAFAITCFSSRAPRRPSPRA
jgi:hypothetical protein